MPGRLIAPALGSLMGYASLVEPRWIEVHEVELWLPRWPAALDRLDIVHLTDFHSRLEGPLERRVAALASRRPPPDLLFLTGDFAERDRALAACERAISPWRATAGTFAVWGNNDYFPAQRQLRLRAMLARLGARLLEAEALTVTIRGTSFALGGLPYYFVRRSYQHFSYPVARLFADVPPTMPRILLSHSPEAFPEAALAGVDLVLSGHTHGGQVCLPGGRPLLQNVARPETTGYTRGLHRRGESWLYVNRGLGNSTVPVRLFARPELLRLTLRSGTDPTAT